MKLLYLAPVFISEHKLDGVAKKVLNHVLVFEKFFDVYMMSYGEEGIEIHHGTDCQVIGCGGSHRRYALYREAEKLTEKDKFECVYIRYPKSEGHFIHLLKRLHSSGARIVSEIPTFPYNGNMFESPQILAIAAVDYVYRSRLKRYIQRIVTFSDDDRIFGIPTIRTINGIVFDKVEIVRHSKEKNSINLISVATNYDCHGFDRIIGGMEKYYSEGGIEEIRFMIVGEGPAIANYEKQISQSRHLKGRVELMGFQTGDTLRTIYDLADIAVNSLALYRLGLKKESTLKTKEYAAKGLPMISSTEVDGLDEEGNKKYVYLVQDCGDIINVDEIIDFYHQIYDGKDADGVAYEIREAGRRICDMSVTMKPVIDYLLGEKD